MPLSCAYACSRAAATAASSTDAAEWNESELQEALQSTPLPSPVAAAVVVPVQPPTGICKRCRVSRAGIHAGGPSPPAPPLCFCTHRAPAAIPLAVVTVLATVATSVMFLQLYHLRDVMVCGSTYLLALRAAAHNPCTVRSSRPPCSRIAVYVCRRLRRWH
ncbi:MAG: hypothetical protein EOO41_03395 [Methanobacteriota archaeon]|nr:MAG: hypothetical protein EOO41_03395 [Euryarchaeota archaeon]